MIKPSPFKLIFFVLALLALHGCSADKDNNTSSNPATAQSKTIVDIEVGTNNSCVLYSNGAINCWGPNTGTMGLPIGQSLGDNANEMGDALAASALGTDSSVTKIDSGLGDHTCALFQNGKVKCWGNNSSAQLGIEGDYRNKGDDSLDLGDNLPYVNLGTDVLVTDIAVGFDHSCALLTGGAVKCWGNNSVGQLGLMTPSAITGDLAMGDSLEAVNLGTGRTATKIGSGYQFSCALLDNNDLQCWGSAAFGKLGNGAPQSVGDDDNEMGDALVPVMLGTGFTPVDFALGNQHACAASSVGEVKCWGNNSAGQLGQEDTATRGQAAGGTDMGDALLPINLGTSLTATQVHAGNNFSCALLNNSGVKCWGEGIAGKLGNENNVSIGDAATEMGDNLAVINLGTSLTVNQMSSGADFNCAVLSDDSLKCWGSAADGRLGQEHVNSIGDTTNEMGDNLLVTSLGTGLTIQHITAGAGHACALLNNSQVKCWGNNSMGQLGQLGAVSPGDEPGEMIQLPELNLGTDLKASKLSMNHMHACAVFTNGKIKCWGENNGGQLGHGNTEELWGYSIFQMGDYLPYVNLGTQENVTDVATGLEFSCALLENGQVKCWGSNNYGQLGTGDTLWRGSAASDMGTNLPFVDLGSNRYATQLDAENYSACAILDNGDVKCWGANFGGNLGQNDTNHRGDALGEMGDDLPAIALGTGRTAKSIAMGETHVCAILDDDSMKCWGWNTAGQLGHETTVSLGGAGGDMAILPTTNLGSLTPSQVIAGRNSSCVIATVGTLTCWGSAEFGMLGLENTLPVGDTTGEMGNALVSTNVGTGRAANQLAIGDNRMCAVLEDKKTVKCWGDNTDGMLGQGDTISRGANPGEMGDNLPASL